MSDVQFNEPEYAHSTLVRPQKASLLSRLIISIGLAQDETGAQRVLFICAVIILIMAIGVYMYGRFVTADGEFVPAYPPATNT